MVINHEQWLDWDEGVYVDNLASTEVPLAIAPPSSSEDIE